MNISKKDHEYSKLIEDLVIISLNNSTSIGKLVKADYEHIELSPFLIYDNINKKYHEIKNKPEIINYQAIQKIQPITAEIYEILKNYSEKNTKQ
ncbi:MAG: hypothetical protein QXK76_04435 [Candidatus Woesearchaeota archaeon]